MRERIAIVSGVRTPMAKAGTLFKDTPADDLGAMIVREAVVRSGVRADEIDEVIIGNVAQPTRAANIARVIALKADLPVRVPAMTVHRNCASGMEAITTAALKILAGYGKIFVAGGVESMSGIPLIFPKEYAEWAAAMARARTLAAMASIAIRVSGRWWPSPRRGSRLASSTSSRTVWTPSPVTRAARRSAPATTFPSTTRRR